MARQSHRVGDQQQAGHGQESGEGAQQVDREPFAGVEAIGAHAAEAPDQQGRTDDEGQSGRNGGGEQAPGLGQAADDAGQREDQARIHDTEGASRSEPMEPLPRRNQPFRPERTTPIRAGPPVPGVALADEYGLDRHGVEAGAHAGMLRLTLGAGQGVRGLQFRRGLRSGGGKRHQALTVLATAPLWQTEVSPPLTLNGLCTQKGSRSGQLRLPWALGSWGIIRADPCGHHRVRCAARTRRHPGVRSRH